MEPPSFLDETRPSLERLRELLASPAPLDAHAAVLHLRRRFEEGQDAPEALAAILPSDWRGLPAEVQRELARLVVDGLPATVAIPPPDLPVFVRLDWTRAALLAHPGLLEDLAGTALADEAVRELPIARVIASGLLERLAASRHPGLHRAVLAHARAGVERALLPPDRAQTLLLELARHARPALAAEALALLAEAWATALPCPPLRDFPRRSDETASASVRVLRARHAVDVLRDVVRDDGVRVPVQREAIAALGEVGAASEVRPLIERALVDPLGFGACALRALAQLRRRGLSPEPDEAYSVLELYLDNASLSADTTAELLSSRGEVVLAALDAVLEATPDWPRWVALLQALGTRGARERLTALVRSERHRAAWHDAIRALGQLEAFEAEPDILARLSEEPEACLFALARLGGARTVTALREVLASPSEARLAWLPRAAEVLFLLDASPETLATVRHQDVLTPWLLRALPAHVSGAAMDVLAALAGRTGDPRRAEAIAALGRTGGPLAVEALSPLLTDPDESVREQTATALRALGRRLHALGAARPAVLLDTRAPDDAVLAEALLRRLEDRALPEEALGWLLDRLQGLTHPRLVRTVRPLLRHRSPEVRKRVVACLASEGARSAAWLVPLLADEDIRIARQVLLALGKVGASEAAGAVAAWLEHPNMNLKKTAAEALATAHDSRTPAVLLSWLGRHDNPGLRSLLRAALKASTGPWLRSRVISALDEASSERTFSLLVQVLGGQLPPEDVAALVARRPAWGATLLRHVYGGDVELASPGALTRLDAELVRRGLAERIPTADAEPPASELRAGFHRADISRRGNRLRARLREVPLPPSEDAELVHLLEQADEPSALDVESLSRWEARALWELHPRMGPRARAGIERLLAEPDLPDAQVALASLKERATEVWFLPGGTAAEASRWDLATARQRLASATGSVRDLASRAVVLEMGAEAPDLRTLSPDVAVAWAVHHGAHERLIEWSLLQSGPELSRCARAIAQVEGAQATASLLLGWLKRYPAQAERLARALSSLGSEVDDEVRALAASENIETRTREHLLASLSGRGGEAHRTFLRRALDERMPGLLHEAARQLLALGGVEDRHRVLEARLSGALGEGFTFPLRRSESPRLADWIRGARSEQALLAAIRLLATGDEELRIPLLLEAWRSPHEEARARARDALRGCAPEKVYARIAPRLRAGDLAWLDVLGGSGAIPGALAKWAESTPEAVDDWSRAFVRMAGGHLLHAPEIAFPLAEAVAQEPRPERLHALARLTDWHEPERAEVLTRALGKALSGEHRERILRTWLEALRELPTSARFRLLARVVRPSDTRGVVELAHAVVQEPTLAAGLPEALRGRVDAQLERDVTASGDTEHVRRILTLRAREARTPGERDALVDLLERSLDHRHARVRGHAHRLLSRNAPREHYLRATHKLLADKDAQTVRRGIRVLAHGGQLEATPALAALLGHPEPRIRQAAREGLLVLGPPAIKPLTSAVAHERPDRRDAMLQVLAELRALNR